MSILNTIIRELILFAFTYACLVAITSCSDEIEYHISSTEEISYQASLHSIWDNAESRANHTNRNIVSISVTPAKNYAYPIKLYLHELTTKSGGDDKAQKSTPNSRGYITEKENGICDFSQYEFMGVIAYAYDKIFPENQSPNFIKNDKVKLSNDIISSGRYWPADDYDVSFFAYAPFDKINIQNPILGFPSFTYTTPTDVNNHIDLLATPHIKTHTRLKCPVNVEFNHALTAVNIIASENFEKGIIKSVSITNICTTADLKWDNNSFSWSNQSNPHTYSFEFKDGKPVGNNKVADINADSDGLTMFLIPQVLTDDNYIEVCFEDYKTRTEHTLQLPLVGHTLRAGTHVVYNLSTSEKFIVPVFEMNLTKNGVNEETNSTEYSQDFDYLGHPIEDSSKDEKSFIIESYALVATSSSQTIAEIPLKWEAIIDRNQAKAFSIDKLTNEIQNGQYLRDISNFVRVEPQSQSDIFRNSHVMRSSKNVQDYSEYNPYDLSTLGGKKKMTTANCYIVNEPGWYSFPLVYGNGIKNGISNTSAYVRTQSGTTGYPLKVLKNYLNKDISSPYIYEDVTSFQINYASLIWEDAYGLISDVKLDEDKKNIIFKVTDVPQGNAVIAVYDNLASGNRIMWSWHIWRTDYTQESDIKITNAQLTTNNISGEQDDYYFMSKNLGWCDGHAIYYDYRDAQITFKQYDVNNNLTNIATLKISQNEFSDVCNDNNTLYQWGRKDPIPGVVIDGSNKSGQKIIYGIPIEKKTQDFLTISKSIQNPTIFCFNSNNTWMSPVDTPCNLWAINQAGYVEASNEFTCIKTVYDPSPRGYKVPDNRVFYNSIYGNIRLNWIVDSEKAYVSNENFIQIPISGIVDDVTGQHQLLWSDHSDGNILKSVGRIWTARCQGKKESSHYCVKFWNNNYSIDFHHSGCGISTGMAIRPMRDYGVDEDSQ